jgi:hypothetical protein
VCTLFRQDLRRPAYRISFIAISARLHDAVLLGWRGATWGVDSKTNEKAPSRLKALTSNVTAGASL